MRRAAILALVLLAACRQEMAEQPKYEALDPSEIWADGASARPAPEGTVARGALAR